MKTLAAVVVLLCCLGLGLPFSVVAQDSVAVPTLVGLNVPQAAAVLNRLGLRLGSPGAILWDASSGLEQNTIGTQSVAPGAAVEPGTAIDVMVHRKPNIALIYDDNDLTVVNLSGAALNIAGLTMTAIEGTPSSFAASRWAGTLEPGRCGQVWSIVRSAPKDVEGCAATFWLTTNNAQEHFWTTANGVARFSVLDNGVERAICQAADPGTQDQPLRCEAYVSGGADPDEMTPYVYFAYTTDAFTLMNSTSDKWMPTSQTVVLNYNPGLAIPGVAVMLGDPALYGNPAIMGDISLLAPGQCLLLTSDNPEARPPERCDPIARLDLTSSVAFWLAPFEITGAADDETRSCPAAVAERIMVCVMPR